MLNLEETLESSSPYIIQRDLFIRSFGYAGGVITLIELVRSQVSEIDLLQLIPGLYLILVFSGAILLIITSDFIFRIPFETDNNKSFGTKTLEKLQIGIILKIAFSLFISCLFVTLNIIIPLSLDSFNSYGEKTLENIWSLDEVINIESVLLTILIVISQIPISLICTLNTERETNFLPEFWKIVSLVIFIISGFLTPTIDGYTQLSFAFSALSLYLILINLLIKRTDIKFNSLNSISF